MVKSMTPPAPASNPRACNQPAQPARTTKTSPNSPRASQKPTACQHLDRFGLVCGFTW
jgi:hypothetical protein